MSGGGGGGGNGVSQSVSPVLEPLVCLSCGERGLEVSLQGPALALRRQGAGTRQLKFVLPALGIYRLVQHYRHATLCYHFYFTRLSRPTESRDWGEAREQGCPGHAPVSRSTAP
jgi:hypothetical protein